jgi:hypothetical protein
MLGNKNVYKIYYSGNSDSKSVAIMKEELATLLKDAPGVLTESVILVFMLRRGLWKVFRKRTLARS